MPTTRPAPHLDRVVQQIKQAGMAAVTVSPPLRSSSSPDILDQLDMVLIIVSAPALADRNSYREPLTAPVASVPPVDSSSNALISGSTGVNTLTGRDLVEPVRYTGNEAARFRDPRKPSLAFAAL